MSGQATTDSQRRILLIDDQPLMRMIIRDLLADARDLTVCGETGERTEAINLATQLGPHLILLDLLFDDGDTLDLIVELKARCPGTLVLVFSRVSDPKLAERATLAGADGVMLKQESALQVVNGIRQTLGGLNFFSNSISRSLLKRMLGRENDRRLNRLTDEEKQLLEGLANGRTSAQIATQLKVASTDINQAITALQSKLDFAALPDLVVFATEHFSNWLPVSRLRRNEPPSAGD